MRTQQAHILYVIRTARDVLLDNNKREQYNNWLDFGDNHQRNNTHEDPKQTDTIFYPNGNSYQGNLKNEKPNGIGSLYGPNGTLLFTGEWLDGVRHGRGTAYDTNGRVLHEGTWHYGAFQEQSNHHSQQDSTPQQNQQKQSSPTQNRTPANHNSGSYAVRPFILSDFSGFLTREYGINASGIYMKKDFLGMGEFGRTELDTKNIGTPSYNGFFTGDVTAPGEMGNITVTLKNVFSPKTHFNNIKKLKNGQRINAPSITANTIIITAAIGLTIFAATAASASEIPENFSNNDNDTQTSHTSNLKHIETDFVNAPS